MGQAPLPAGLPIQLGEHEYRVVEQRHARLRRQMTALFSKLGGLEEVAIEGPDDLLDMIGTNVYELLSIFVPDIMPEHEFNGYASEEAMKEDRYEEDFDRSPTVPQIKAALAAGVRINGFDWLDKLKDFIGTDFLRAQTRARLAEWSMNSVPGTATPTSTPSPTSQPENGASPQTSSSPLSPTPELQTS